MTPPSSKSADRAADQAELNKWLVQSLAIIAHNNNASHNALVASFEAQREIANMDYNIMLASQNLHQARFTHQLTAWRITETNVNLEPEESEYDLHLARKDIELFEKQLAELKVKKEELVAQAQATLFSTHSLPLPQPPISVTMPMEGQSHTTPSSHAHSHVSFLHNFTHNRSHKGDAPGAGTSPEHRHASLPIAHSRHHSSAHPRAHVLAVSGKSVP